jgi:hypothetical protein
VSEKNYEEEKIPSYFDSKTLDNKKGTSTIPHPD